MTGLRLSPDAMAVVGAASVLLYLVAQQVTRAWGVTNTVDRDKPLE
jgi:hypothetical protein